MIIARMMGLSSLHPPKKATPAARGAAGDASRRVRVCLGNGVAEAPKGQWKKWLSVEVSG